MQTRYIGECPAAKQITSIRSTTRMQRAQWISTSSPSATRTTISTKFPTVTSEADRAFRLASRSFPAVRRRRLREDALVVQRARPLCRAGHQIETCGCWRKPSVSTRRACGGIIKKSLFSDKPLSTQQKRSSPLSPARPRAATVGLPPCVCVPLGDDQSIGRSSSQLLRASCY